MLSYEELIARKEQRKAAGIVAVYGETAPVAAPTPLPVLCENLGRVVKRESCSCVQRHLYRCDAGRGDVRPVSDCGPQCPSYEPQGAEG